jgi:hypothetical protein
MGVTAGGLKKLAYWVLFLFAYLKASAISRSEQKLDLLASTSIP